MNPKRHMPVHTVIKKVKLKKRCEDSKRKTRSHIQENTQELPVDLSPATQKGVWQDTFKVLK